MSCPAAFAPSSGISRQARFVVSYQKRNEQVKGKGMIQWPCKECGEKLEVPESLAKEPIECPSCGAVTSPASKFVRLLHTEIVPNSDAPPERERPLPSFGTLLFGLALLLTGLILTIRGFALNTAPNGVHNTGLLNQQLIFVIAGTGSVMTGALLLGMLKIGIQLAKSIRKH